MRKRPMKARRLGFLVRITFVVPTMTSQASTCSTSAPNPAGQSGSHSEAVPSSSSIPTAATDQHPTKARCRKKMLGKAERMIMLENNA